MHVLLHKRRGGDEAISEARRGPAGCRSCLMQADKVLAMTTAEGPLGWKPVCKWTWCRVKTIIRLVARINTEGRRPIDKVYVLRFWASEATLYRVQGEPLDRRHTRVITGLISSNDRKGVSVPASLHYNRCRNKSNRSTDQHSLYPLCEAGVCVKDSVDGWGEDYWLHPLVRLNIR